MEIQVNSRVNSGYAVNKEVDDNIDLKKLIFRFLMNWYWFVLTAVFALGVAYVYNKNSVPVFEISSTMLVEEGNYTPTFGGGTKGMPQNIFQGLGAMNSMQNIFNQMTILGSTPIIARTLNELDFEVSYYEVERFVSLEKYKDLPFVVLWDEQHPQVIDADFNLTIEPSGKIYLSVDEKEATVYSYIENKETGKRLAYSFSKTVDPGTKILSSEFSFTILLKELFKAEYPNNYKFRFNTRSALVRSYRNKLKVSLDDEYTSILTLTLRDYNFDKSVAFLNKLSEVYQLDNLEKKNENANRTVQFITSQLENISDSLNISETRMESFQNEHKVLDISVQSQQLLVQMRELDQEKVALEAQNKYFHYLKDYISTGNNQELETAIVPSAMGIQDPLLNSLILQVNELLMQKSSLTSIRSDSQHPAILRLNAQIEVVNSSLMENVNSIISKSDMALENLNQNIRRFEEEVRRLPATERNYVNIERKYKLNNEIYTYLLQKLSEAQLAKASNIPDSQVIEEPQMKGTEPVEPKTMMIYAIGLLLGLATPAGILLLTDFFNNKIVSQEDIEAVTRFPIIGHIIHSESEKNKRTLVLDRPNSPASESYKAIRTKLSLITKGKANFVIAVTSTFPKEGKSYNAVNIASSFALLHKKTVLLDLDLRNSKLKKEFGLTSDLGVVNYIIGRAGLAEITFPTKHPWLKIIPAGPIPPNPGEMLTDSKLLELLAELRENYDVIVIDTAPAGYVADLFYMHDFVDTNLFVVRHKFTHKLALKNTLEEVQKHKLNGVGLLINDIRVRKRNHSISGDYGYGYGYGYGYIHDYGKGKMKDKSGESSDRIVLKKEELEEEKWG